MLHRSIRNFVLCTLLCVSNFVIAQSGSGDALDLSPGNTAIVTTTGSSISDLDFPFTLLYWMKVDASTGVQPIISTANSANGYQGITVEYEPTPGVLRVILGNNTSFNLPSNDVMISTIGAITNQWVHIAITFNSAAQGAVYVNGAPRGTTSISAVPGITPTFPTGASTNVGYIFDQASHHYEGELDEMSLWSRELPLTEIRDHMCERLTGNEPALEAYWRFDGTGLTISDLSGNGNDLSLGIGTGASRSISGAPVGEQSNHTYNIGTVSISSPQGVTLSAINGTGGTDGVHVYYNSSHPDQDQGISSLCDTIGHFGRFIATNPNQPNIPGIITIAPAMSLIYTRPSSNQGTWVTAPVTQNLFFSDIRREFLFDPAQFPSINLGDVPACGSGSVTAPQIINATYLWSTGGTTRTIPTPPPGQHWVTMTTNCASITDTFEVFRDTISEAVALEDSAFYCPNDSVNIAAYNSTGAPAIDSVIWSDGVTGRFRTASQTGWLYAWVALSGSCWAYDSIYVSESSRSFDLGNDTTLCAGDIITLQVPSNASNVMWGDGSQGQFLNVSTPGTYFVEFDIDGCGLSDTIQVDVLDFSINTIDITSICVGETANLTFSANAVPDSVYWSTGDNANSISTTDAGFYWIEAFLGNCYDSDTIEVEVLEGVTNTSAQNVTLCTGETVELRLEGIVPDSYIEDIQWSDGSLGDSLIVARGGTYIANGVSPCGPYSVQFLVDEVRCEIWLFIPNAFSPNADGLNDRFETSLTGLKEFKMEIFDRWGNTVFSTTDVNESWDGTRSGEPVQEGAYGYKLVGRSYKDKVVERTGFIQVIR